MFLQYSCRPESPCTVKGRVQIDVEPSLARKSEIRAHLVIIVIGWKYCCVDLELQNGRGGRKLIVEYRETLKGYILCWFYLTTATEAEEQNKTVKEQK